MTIGAFITFKTPERRGDLTVGLDSILQWSDQIVYVDGAKMPGYMKFLIEYLNKTDSIKTVCKYWPTEFDWSFIGKQFQLGYEAATTDWVFHMDSDFIFHECDYDAIRKACENAGDAPALSFWKYAFISPNQYNLKSRLVIAVNKGKYGNRIRFDSGADLCQPSLDGKELKPDDVPEARIPFHCYEKILKTKDQVKDDVGRMARAWQRHFGEYKLGGPDDESAYKEWYRMMLGRFSKPQQQIPIESHPKVMQETIKSLRPEQFGYSMFSHYTCPYFVNSDKIES